MSSQDLKNEIKNRFSKLVSDNNHDIDTRQLNLNQEYKNNKHKYQKLSLGEPNYRDSKVFLVVGATGTGKTTLINAFVNQIYGIDFTDDFRFQLIDGDKHTRSSSESQTDIITAYTLYHKKGMKHNYDLTIIDTPGFGDTRGIDQDKKFVTRLLEFFKHDFEFINGVCFVVQSSSTRLSDRESYIFQELITMFAKNVAPIINIMLTWYGGANKPPALQTIKDAGVNYSRWYKFNNLALFEKNDNMLMKIYYDISTKSIDDFLNNLANIEDVELEDSIEVLGVRENLKANINCLQKDLEDVVQRHNALKDEKEMLRKISRDVKDHENYKEETYEFKDVAVSAPGMHYNCTKCLRTCCVSCNMYEWPIFGCGKFKNGRCQACKGNCPYNVHIFEGKKYQKEKIKVMRTVSSIFERYKLKLSDKNRIEESIKHIEANFLENGSKVIELLLKIKKQKEVIFKKALNYSNMSMSTYLESLIKAEENNQKADSVAKINFYKSLMEKESLMTSIDQIGFNELNNKATQEQISNIFKSLI